MVNITYCLLYWVCLSSYFLLGALKQDNKLDQNDHTTLSKMDFIATEQCHYAKNSDFIFVLSSIFLLCWELQLLCWGCNCYAECRYDECRYAECRGPVKNNSIPAKLYLAPSPTRSQVVVTHLWWLRRLCLHAVLLHRRRYDDPVSFGVCLRRCNLFPENPNRWFNLYAETSGLYYKSCTIVITVRS